MTKYIIKKILLFSLIFSSLISFCQQKNDSLEAYLQKIQNQFNVEFNYNSSIVASKNCTHCTIDQNLDLRGHLKRLEKKFSLTFSIVSATKIIIKKLNIRQLTFIEAEKNTPIKDLFVQDKSLQSYWITDEMGTIRLKNEIPESILVSHLNYGEKEILLKNIQNDTVKLKPNNHQLNVLQLYSFFTNGTYKNKKGDFFIQSNKIEVLAGLTAHDVIKNLENLPQIVSNSESTSDLIVRGGTQDQNLFVWNGIKVYQNHHFFGLISAFNENLVSKISLYDNATPAQYGNNTSGVISLDHNDKISKKISAGLGLNFLSQDAYIKLPLSKKVEIQLSGRKSMTEFWKSPTYLKYSKKVFESSLVNTNDNLQNYDITNNEDFNFHDFQLQYLYKPNVNNNININGIYLKNYLSYIEEDVQNVNSKKSDLKQQNMALGINWIHFFNTGKITSGLNYSKHIMAGGNFLLSKDIASKEYNSIENYESSLQYTSLLKKSNFQYNLGVSHDFLSVSNNTTNFNALYIYNRTQNNNIYNVFGSLTYQKNKILTGLDLRNSYYEFLKSFQVEPRFYVSYALFPKFYSQFRAERKTQNISQIIDLENNFLGIEKRRWIMANNSVAPMQRSNQLELAFNFKTNKSNLSASIYHKKVSGITTSNQGFQNLHQFDNQFGKYTINGIQGHYNIKSQYFNAWLSYNYSINKYTFKGLKPSSFYNSNDIRNSVISGVNYKYKAFNISFGMEYNSGKPFTAISGENAINDDVFTTINYLTPNTKRLSDYLRFDSTVSCNLNLNELVKLKLAFGIINITNRNNILNRYYTLSQDKKAIEVLDKHGLEFTPNLSLNLNF